MKIRMPAGLLLGGTLFFCSCCTNSACGKYRVVTVKIDLTPEPSAPLLK